MKFKIHAVIQVVIFLIIWQILGWLAATVITLFHFIPSLDYVMKKTNFYPQLHRCLFHNIFIIIISSSIILLIASSTVATLSIVNLLLHVLMDLNGEGVAFFYPLSKYRVTLNRR
jgi:hypothetical protein